MAESRTSFHNHLVICGWKQDMELVVSEILHADPQWNDAGVVIVARVTEEDISDFKAHPRLSHVHIIVADSFHEGALLKASIQSASKVVVLADWSDKNMTATETDAKTVMTVMAIEKLAPHVYTIAELLDPDYAVYLKIAHVDELIYPREYSRILLANASTSAGISHVVYDLLTVDTPSVMTTVPFPPEFVGKPFRDLFRYFDGLPEPRSICVGLLENTGNLHALKRRAKTEAQKTLEIRAVLANLKLVKEIKPNLPRLNPGDDYVIPGSSLAIVLITPEEVRAETAAGEPAVAGKS